MRKVAIFLSVLAACGSTPPPAAPVEAPPPAASPLDDVPPLPALPVVNTTLSAVGLDGTMLDRAADPCEDFFQFACGGWIERTKIADDKPGALTGFQDIIVRNSTSLHAVMSQKAETADPIAGPPRTFFAACTDTAAIEKAGLKALQPLRTVIGKVKDAKTLSAAVVALQLAGIEALFAFGAVPDAKDATSIIAGIDQGGMGLPNRDYYLKDDHRAARTAYATYVTGLLVAAGASPAAAAKDAEAVLALETDLAKASRSIEETRNPQALYNRLDKAGVSTAAPSFDWPQLWTATGVTTDAVTVRAPAFLARVETLLGQIKPGTWRAYLTARLFATLAPHLPSKIEALQFAFDRALTGVATQHPRAVRCVNATMELMPDVVGQLFVRTNFSAEHRREALVQIAAIVDAMKHNLERLAWMDAETRTRALAKLDAMTNQVGYPDAWHPFTAKLDRRAHVANVLATRTAEARRDFSRIGKPDDRRYWNGDSAAEVNAFYDPGRNTMLFPAGILQPPLFTRDASTAVNLGAMGMFVGHELTHGFDDEGSQYDANGNLADWWQPATRTEFTRRTKCIVDQYAQYDVAGQKVNGATTLGENIADIGGVKLAFTAYRALRSSAQETQIADGFTEDQQFFISFGQTWCAKLRPDFEAMLATIDVHAPPRWRVNGSLAATPAFATAFRCAPGSKLAPVNACSVW